MYKVNLKNTAFNKVRVAQSVERQTTDLRIVGSNPTVCKKNFSLYFVAFDAHLAGRLVPYK